MDWIKIKDKQPTEDAKDYLVIDEYGTYHVAQWWEKGKRGNKRKSYFDEPYYGQEVTGSIKVVYWCELPTAP